MKGRLLSNTKSFVHVFQDGVWVSSLDYKNAQPDPLRDCAEKLVDEINTNNMEDITRFCNVYVDLDFQVWPKAYVSVILAYCKDHINSSNYPTLTVFL